MWLLYLIVTTKQILRSSDKMLTEGQKNYLAKLPPERAEEIITVNPYDHKTTEVAEEIISQIIATLPEADTRFMGASALGISGQNDVDIYILCSPEMKDVYLSKLTPVFGEQVKNKWQWFKEGIEVSVYLSDPSDYKFQEQLKIFEILKNTPEVLREYELLKQSVSRKTYNEYQIAKYEFYNKTLGLS